MTHHHHLLPSSLFPVSFLFIIQVMIVIPLSLGDLEAYKACRDAQFRCGKITAGYPFSGDGIPLGCGHPDLQLLCENGTTTIEIVNARYQVLDILPPDGQTQTLRIRIARQDHVNNDLCNPGFQNSSLDYGPFELVNASGYANATLLYGCQNFIQTSLGHFNCSGNGDRYKDFWVVSGVNPSSSCSASISLPIKLGSFGTEMPNNYSFLLRDLKQGVYLKWKHDSRECETCNRTGGACAFNFENQTTCYCPDATDLLEGTTECRRLTPAAAPTPVGGLAILAGSAILAIFVGMGILSFKHKSRDLPTLPSRRGPPLATASIEAFIMNFGSLAPKRYSYADIKKMTNRFKDKLGQGGYGSVYKGNLADRRLVAVKILSESKGNGEDFMNEVASIGRTSHVNIVTLLGFCYDKSRRALIYEFMPHGSLDRYIYSQGSEGQSRHLEWKTLYDIALGIAKGLEYLHQGCSTRILHFDIKPHNILLDDNFCPKISDFGLSKLCERKESIISMTGTRGTVGYIAPEVFCRNFGGVSHKSDVYSFGMMVLEMVGGRKNIDAEVSKSSEIYFPSWIYKQLDQGMTSSIDGVTAEEEEEITRRLIVVSLWCIQTNPIDRPSMTKVLEMLQGSLQSLVIPPRPFLSSPVRSPKSASTT
ncbi:hypothetical protein PTKIN_Ptkin12aG0051900 [Pterospermum kingtungense]